MTPGAVMTVWGASLALGVVVIVVVATLLELIVRGGRRLEAVLGAIWTAGQAVANNTIHIALLHRTTVTMGRILNAVGGALKAAAAIHDHARQCPRCPTCARTP